MTAFSKSIKRFIRDEEGVTALEYALIAALIAVVILVALKFIGNNVKYTFETVGGELNDATGGS